MQSQEIIHLVGIVAILFCPNEEIKKLRLNFLSKARCLRFGSKRVNHCSFLGRSVFVRTNKHHLHWGLLFLLTQATPVWSLTYKDLEEIVLQNNPSIQIAQNGFKVAERTEDNAESLRLPNLDAVGGAQKFQDENEVGHQMSIGARISWPLYQGGRISNGIKAARARVGQVGMAERINRILIRKELRESFAQAVYAKNLTGLSQKIYDRRRKNLEFTRLQYDGGLEFAWVVKSQEAKVKNAEIRIMEADLTQRSALADLEAIAGTPAAKTIDEIDPVGFYAEIPQYDLSSMLTIVENHPESQRQVGSLTESTYRVKVSQGARLPTLALQSDLLMIDTHDEPVFPFWSVGVRLTMPLFEGRRNIRNVEIARLRKENEELDLADTKRKLKSTITAAFQGYQLAQRRVSLAQINYDTNNDRANVVTQQYRSGMTNFLNWERAMDDWEQSEDGLLRAIRDAQVATARYEQTIGMELR